MTSLLENLRAQITDIQRAALTACWQYYCDNGQWISIRRLYNEHGGKSVVRPALDDLGGSVIFEQQDPTIPRYQLMFLGVLLTDDGERYEQLLAQYLGYLVTISQQDPDRISVKSEEVAGALNLTQEQTILLGILLYVGEPFRESMGGYRTQDWHAAIPDSIEDLPSNLVQYVQGRAMERYYPDAPLAILPRNDYYQNARTLESQTQYQGTSLSPESSYIESEPEEITVQQDLLRTYRRTLAHYLQQ
jgi:hypothetical protein